MISSIQFPILYTKPWARGGVDIAPASKESEFCWRPADELYGCDDMLIFDSAGRTWKVTGFQASPIPLPPATFWERLTRRFWPPLFDVSYVFADTPQLSLDEIKEKLCEAVGSDPYTYWAETEVEAGVGAQLRPGEHVLDPLKARIRATPSFSELFVTLFPEDFGPNAKKPPML